MKRTPISRIIIGLIIGLILFPQLCPGQTLLTLDLAISRALTENNQIKSSQFSVSKAKWNRRQAWTQLFPTISLNSRMMRIDDQTLAERDFSQYFNDPNSPIEIPQTVFQESYYTSIDLDMPIFNGAILNGISIANKNVDMARSLDESTRNQIVFQVVSGYLQILQAEEILKIQKEYLELSRLNFEKAERMQKAGRYSQAEVLRWKVEYEQQKSIVVSGESTVRTVHANLARLVNFDMRESIVVDPQIPSALLSESERLQTLSEDELVRLIQLSDDDLKTANASLAAAQSNVRLNQLLYRNSYTSYMPNVTLNYSHGWRENETLALDDYSPKTLVLNLSMPLFTSFQNWTATRAAYYDYKQSQSSLADQMQNTRFLLTETVNKLLNLKNQRQLSKTTVEFSEHNYRIVEQQRAQGLVSNIDFIDAKLNLQNARLNEVNTHYDFISAMVELYYLQGDLDKIIDLD